MLVDQNAGLGFYSLAKGLICLEPDMELTSLYRNFVVTPAVLTAPASAVADSVDTLLPQGSQSVAPVAASSSLDQTENGSTAGGQPHSPTPGLPGQTPTVAVFTRDTATNALVFMEINPQTQAVIVQFPDERSLKLRSYLAEMQRRAEAAQQSSPGSHVAKTT